MSEIREKMLSGLAEKFAIFLDTEEGRQTVGVVGRPGLPALSLSFTAGAVACLELLDWEMDRKVSH